MVCIGLLSGFSHGPSGIILSNTASSTVPSLGFFKVDWKFKERLQSDRSDNWLLRDKKFLILTALAPKRRVLQTQLQYERYAKGADWEFISRKCETQD